MTDNVNHPEHYCKGKIEVIDCIESLIAGRDPEEAYALGNAIKYIARAGSKDPKKYVEDLDKAIWYINRAKITHHNKTSDFKVPLNDPNLRVKNSNEAISDYMEYAHTQFIDNMMKSYPGFKNIGPGIWIKNSK